MVGLGNPGRQYEVTRHNAGFLALDLLAERLNTGAIRTAKCRALIACGSYAGKNLVLVKPQTYMNLSGEAVRDLAGAYKVPPERIIVVFDDLDLAPGRIRVRKSGSAGGHNGIKSIIYQLNSDQFPRVKIGIGDPQRSRDSREDTADFVLSPLSSDSYEGVKAAPQAVLDIIAQGVDFAMQQANSKKPAAKADAAGAGQKTP